MHSKGFQRKSSPNVMYAAVLLFTVFFISGCGPSQDSVVATIGNYDLSLKEYEKQFIKNNGGVAAGQRSTPEERKDFLDLLIKYRLKVLEAKDKGYDKDPEILKELKEYRNSLAVPYLTERALIDPEIEKLHRRKKEELRVAHILFRTVPDTTGNVDTVRIRAEAQKVLTMALQGGSFDSLAKTYSQDPGTAPGGGDLMYFTAGMTTPAFDDAIYQLRPGEIGRELVQTMFGFHIVKMLERKPSRGEIRCSHILVRIPQENPSDTASAYAKILSIKDTLSRGGNFEELARRNSEDPQSGANGGDLGWVGRRRFVPEFEMVAFNMKVGETSDVVRTAFGYHLIKLTDERTQKPLEESRQELKDIYRRYGFDEANTKFVQSIGRKHGTRIHEETIARLVEHVDTVSTTAAAGWYNNIPDDLKNTSIVSLNKKTVTIGDAIAIIERNRDLQGKPLNRASLKELARLIGEKEAFEMETEDLEQRYPEFAELMQEYKEGVLLFRTEQDAVWNKVSVKEDALKAYWEEYKADYQWPDRVQFLEIFVASDSLARVLRDSVNAGVDFGELAGRHTQRAGYKEKKGDWGLQSESANELSQQAMRMEPGWVEGPMKFQYGHSIIKVIKKDRAREKTFEEAQSEVSSKFQEVESKRLEREWIETLRKKYGVTINNDALQKAFQTMPKAG